RYALTIASGDDAAIDHALTLLGVRNWYSYGFGTGGPSGRVQMLRTGARESPVSDDATIRAVALARPGSYWLIGNEGNVQGEDWGSHSYQIDWGHLPMTGTAEPQNDVQAFRAYVDAIPGHAGKPIWVTELGVIWG